MIIGICGLIGSGKDTIAQYLIDSREYKRISFASTLKDATAILFGWDRIKLEGTTTEDRQWREEPDPFWTKRLRRLWSPRIALQTLGTELLRDGLDPAIWIYAAERKIEALGNNTNVVISDCRFPNEIDMIQKLGGQVWWVRRGELPTWWEDVRHTARAYPYPSKVIIDDVHNKYGVHYSEWAWIDTTFNAIFDNDWSLADLYKTVEEYMEDYSK